MSSSNVAAGPLWGIGVSNREDIFDAPVHGQMRKHNLQGPGYMQILALSTPPTINDTLCVYHPTSGIGSLNSVEIRYIVTEIRTQVEASSIDKKSDRHGRSPEDDDSFTFDLY